VTLVTAQQARHQLSRKAITASLMLLPLIALLGTAARSARLAPGGRG